MKRALPLLALAACVAPEMDTFNQLQIDVVEGEEATSRPFVALIEGAERSLHVAIPAGEDVALSEAIIDAWDRGVDVEVVTDIDQREDAGIALLLDEGVPVRLASDGIAYFDFNINADVSWVSEQTIMAHAYAVADRQRIVAANRVGTLDAGTRVVLQLTGERIVEDLLAEHNQLFGGIDATATTAFDGLAKSVVDFRWLYPTQTDVDLEMWFGPQERLTKRIIDAVYSARSSAWVLTNDFADEGLARALQEKAKWGFDMRVVVGPDFSGSNPLLSRILSNETPDVEKRQVDDADVPTIVVVDWDEGRDGRKHTTRVFVLNHDLYSATRLHRGIEVVNDQLIDAALWVLVDYDEPSEPLHALQQVFWDHHERGGAL